MVEASVASMAEEVAHSAATVAMVERVGVDSAVGTPAVVKVVADWAAEAGPAVGGSGSQEEMAREVARAGACTRRADRTSPTYRAAASPGAAHSSHPWCTACSVCCRARLGSVQRGNQCTFVSRHKAGRCRGCRASEGRHCTSGLCCTSRSTRLRLCSRPCWGRQSRCQGHTTMQQA